MVRLTPDETKPTIKLRWFPIKRGKDEAGELLAAFELFLLPESDTEKKMPPHPPKRGALFTVPQSIRPQLVRTGIEVSFLQGANSLVDDCLDSLLGCSEHEDIHVIRCRMSSSDVRSRWT